MNLCCDSARLYKAAGRGGKCEGGLITTRNGLAPTPNTYPSLHWLRHVNGKAYADKRSSCGKKSALSHITPACTNVLHAPEDHDMRTQVYEWLSKAVGGITCVRGSELAVDDTLASCSSPGSCQHSKFFRQMQPPGLIRKKNLG